MRRHILLVAVAAATLLMEGCPVPTCVELSEDLVKLSGHPELVNDAKNGDYSVHSDNRRPNARTFLNMAHKKLERFLPHVGELSVLKTTLDEGAYSINVPDLRFVSFIEINDGTTRCRLVRKELEELYRLYDEPIADIEAGMPLYWATSEKIDVNSELLSNIIMIERGSVELREVVEPVAFKMYDGVEPLTGAGWELVGSELHPVCAPSGNPDLSLWYGSIAGVIAVDDRHAGAIVDIAYIRDNFDLTVRIYGTDSMSIMETHALDASGTLQFTVPVDARLIFIGGDSLPGGGFEIDGEDEGAITSISFQRTSGVNLLILPPSDTAYTLDVYGGYYVSKFTADNDVSWWSNQNPDILLLGARGEVELHLHGNQSRAKMFWDEAYAQAQRVQHALVREEVGELPPEDVKMGFW